MSSSVAVHDERELRRLAAEARSRAYAPYSRFRVGAAVLTAAGRFHMGCNVENASYGLSLCAERVAIFSAVRDEGADLRLRAVAVTCGEGPCIPCGACRQVMSEFGGDDVVVYLVESGGARAVRLADLLPLPFRL